MEYKYISLISESPKNVISSQVVEYFEILKKYDIIFDIIFFLNGRDYIDKRNNFSSIKEEINKRTSGNVKFYPMLKKTSSLGNSIAILILYLNLLKYTNNEKIVVHSRGGSGFFAANLLSKRENVSLVMDFRGDYVSEYIFTAQQLGLSEEKTVKGLKRIKYLEKVAAQKADHLFCVSSVLKDRLIERYHIESNRITIIPCCADHIKFRYESNLRLEMRKKIGIEERFIFVYAGGIGAWHYSEEMFRIVSVLMQSIDSCFMVLTPDVKEALKLAKRTIPNERYFIKNVPREDVSEYLMAADMGILLRERHPLNEVAAPTKFAEYLMAGLPVMISDHIGDYSKFVVNNDLGIVIDNSTQPDEYKIMFDEFLKRKDNLIKENISRLGMTNFSKEKYAKILKDIYLNF